MTVAGTYILDPEAVLDFQVDWTAWLKAAETITSHDVTPSGVVIDSSDEDAGVVTVWVSGATLGQQSATVQVTTNQGRTDERTLHFIVQER